MIDFNIFLIFYLFYYLINYFQFLRLEIKILLPFVLDVVFVDVVVDYCIGFIAVVVVGFVTDVWVVC